MFVVRCTKESGTSSTQEILTTTLNSRLGELVARNICKQHAEQGSKAKFNNADEKEIARSISSKNDLDDIIKGLCLIASGLVARPDRPTSPHKVTMFKPFSSSDSHIMMQLKRSVEVISTLDNIKRQKRIKGSSSRRKGKCKRNVGGTSSSSNRLRSSGRTGRIRIIINGALRAGKAARNEAAVPEILQLKPYTKSDDEDVPLDLMIETINAVIRG